MYSLFPLTFLSLSLSCTSIRLLNFFFPFPISSFSAFSFLHFLFNSSSVPPYISLPLTILFLPYVSSSLSLSLSLSFIYISVSLSLKLYHPIPLSLTQYSISFMSLLPSLNSRIFLYLLFSHSLSIYLSMNVCVSLLFYLSIYPWKSVCVSLLFSHSLSLPSLYISHSYFSLICLFSSSPLFSLLLIWNQKNSHA